MLYRTGLGPSLPVAPREVPNKKKGRGFCYTNNEIKNIVILEGYVFKC